MATQRITRQRLAIIEALRSQINFKEVWAKQVGLDHGFTDISHTLEISGICKSCRSA